MDKGKPLCCHNGLVVIIGFYRNIKYQKILPRLPLTNRPALEGSAQAAADNSRPDKAHTIEPIVNMLAGHAPISQHSGKVREQRQGQKTLRGGNTEGPIGGLPGVDMMRIKVKRYTAEGGDSILRQLKPRCYAQVLPC
nr:hypothetical protein [Exilibacterium tricleocarpae]